MPEAFKAESLLHAMAGMRLVLFAALFLVAAPLRCRAWACVLALLLWIVYSALFESLTSWCSSSSRLAFVEVWASCRWWLSFELVAMPPAESSG